MANKMTKQVKRMVQSVNDYLKFRQIKETNDPLFSDMCWLLIQGNCYHGFNYFKADGTLSGGKNENFDHLELYIR